MNYQSLSARVARLDFKWRMRRKSHHACGQTTAPAPATSPTASPETLAAKLAPPLPEIHAQADQSNHKS